MCDRGLRPLGVVDQRLGLSARMGSGLKQLAYLLSGPLGHWGAATRGSAPITVRPPSAVDNQLIRRWV